MHATLEATHNALRSEVAHHTDQSFASPITVEQSGEKGRRHSLSVAKMRRAVPALRLLQQAAAGAFGALSGVTVSVCC